MLEFCEMPFFHSVDFSFSDLVPSGDAFAPGVLDGVLYLTVEEGDSVSLADLSFCSNKTAWISFDSRDVIQAERAKELYSRLRALMPPPVVIFMTDTIDDVTANLHRDDCQGKALSLSCHRPHLWEQTTKLDRKEKLYDY